MTDYKTIGCYTVIVTCLVIIAAILIPLYISGEWPVHNIMKQLEAQKTVNEYIVELKTDQPLVYTTEKCLMNKDDYATYVDGHLESYCTIFLFNVIAIRICDIYKIPVFTLMFIYSVAGLSVVAIGGLSCIINEIKVLINKKSYFYAIMLILAVILFLYVTIRIILLFIQLISIS